MRPRINPKFGILSREELFKHLYSNDVHGLTVKRVDDNILRYTFLLMFRSTREKPEEMSVEVSKQSGMVIKGWTSKRRFENKEQLIRYTTK